MATCFTCTNVLLQLASCPQPCHAVPTRSDVEPSWCKRAASELALEWQLALRVPTYSCSLPRARNHATRCQPGLMSSLHGAKGQRVSLPWNGNLLYMYQRTPAVCLVPTTMPRGANPV